MSVQKIYAAIAESEMNKWVGSGDPEIIGRGNFTSIIESLPLERHSAVLDFGCGIGRTSAALAEFLDAGGQLVGSDIVPGEIQFCREQFDSVFPNASFHCVRASNPHYDSRIAETENTVNTMDEDEFFLMHNNSFDLTVAFSVFTHFSPVMSARYLSALGEVTKPSGHLFLTWFLDHPDNPAQFSGLPARLREGETFSDPSGDLLFALFSPAHVARLAASAGLMIERIPYGSWRGAGWRVVPLKGQHFQDVVIFRRTLPSEFDPSVYLEIHKDVAATGVRSGASLRHPWL